MSSYSDRDTYSQAGDWLLGAVRRNPEALLLMAAGCYLMMRGGSSSRIGVRGAQHMRDEWNYQTSRASSEARRASASAREGRSRASESGTDTAKRAGDYASDIKDRVTDAASDYAAEMKDRISDTASSYADSIADFAGDARQKVAERSAQLTRQTQATLQSSVQRVVREQPLAVAVVRGCQSPCGDGACRRCGVAPLSSPSYRNAARRVGVGGIVTHVAVASGLRPSRRCLRSRRMAFTR
jgi:hypothetical protein